MARSKYIYILYLRAGICDNGDSLRLSDHIIGTFTVKSEAINTAGSVQYRESEMKLVRYEDGGESTGYEIPFDFKQCRKN